MKGHPRVIELLNEILTNELTSINQYFIHAKMCANWGYKHLAEHDHKESIGEMKHADEIIERILFLEGVPNLQRLNKIMVGETVPEQLKLDLALELAARTLFNGAIEECRSLGDHVTFDMLVEMVEGEEDHINWLETQIELIRQIGEAHYLAQQMRD